MESNDSPEIPDRGETSDIPDLPSGGTDRETETERKRERAASPDDSAENAGDQNNISCACV